MNKPSCSAILLSIVLATFPVFPILAVEKPELMLAKVFHSSVDVTEYWVSEKLDGVRARWEGGQLISRGGIIFKAPSWFVRDFPDRVLDGELWIARTKYQQIVSIVRKQKPNTGWEQIKFMVFDLPDHPGNFTARVAAMRNIAKQSHAPYLAFIPQFLVSSRDQLMQRLKVVTEQSGEGLMLHHKASFYNNGRSNNLLKLKPYTDAEAVVIGYRPGKGQFLGKMGAIKVRIDNGKEFFIGSGFSHIERENPPVEGSVVTFRYQGLTDSGIPRFAVFLRIRDEP
jgi:DNA ligase-1